jgi:ADP-ribose pyrophosphatase YjhB (NUDIX family)
MTMTSILEVARRLLALSQTGLHFSDQVFDRERYEEIAQLATELLARESQFTAPDLRDLWRIEDGYVTPKIDVRGAVFRDDKVLLVRERSDGKWTMPGGYADVNEWPSLSVQREIEQESGYSARALKLAAVHDRAKHNYPAYMFHIWKLFFICEITGGEARVSSETDGVDFFSIAQLPPLSTGRTTAAQIERMYVHHRDRELVTDFD